MSEEPIQFGPNDSLAGIVTAPSVVHRRQAFVFLNSGILHRVGPNRLHVTMARQLSALGFLSFRIDLSGVGDSPARLGAHSIVERWAEEAQAAMDYVQRSKGIDDFILIGNCSGAAIAFFTAQQDSRVVGAVLINLQGNTTSLRYYMRLALTNRKVWRRLLKGTVRYRDLVKSARGILPRLAGPRGGEAVRSSESIDMHAAISELAARRTKVFAIHSSWDPGLDHFKAHLQPTFDRQFEAERFETAVIPGLNHDFNLLHGQVRLCGLVTEWAARL